MAEAPIIATQSTSPTARLLWAKRRGISPEFSLYVIVDLSPFIGGPGDPARAVCVTSSLNLGVSAFRFVPKALRLQFESAGTATG
jgi:hypothetical protein